MFKLVWYCVLLHTVFGQGGLGFGTSYLKNSRLCHQWTCINTQLGLQDSLPPKEQFISVLRSLLPPGSWQAVADRVAATCYEDRPRRYTSTCPGQALLHCTVDHLIQYCPSESLRKDDACAPLTSLAGFKYMFTQSRYNNLEKHMPKERRPSWFLKNYFSSKCCNLPMLFNSTVVEGCGFDTMIHYHVHEPKVDSVVPFNMSQNQVPITQKSNLEHEKTVATTQKSNENHESSVNMIGIDDQGETVKIVNIDNTVPNMDLDPLECCDLSGFIEPAWRSQCGFQMTWSERNRLTIGNKSEHVSTTDAPTTTPTPKFNDVKMVPETCEKVSCVFRKMNVITDTGSVDLDAFSKLLDNMTIDHNSWVKAKARVVTKCLSKPIKDYVDDCEINRLLACTFDILTENCPHAKRHDPCKHTTVMNGYSTCQISSSKLRPKNRRQFCGIPRLVSHEALKECGLYSISRMEYVPDPVTSRPKVHWWTKTKLTCESSTESTKCLLSKMGVLNKYGFLDYFKMKDRIRQFTSQRPEWAALTDVYLNIFTAIPMYGQQCSTPKKLLNILDSMFMTCPASKRTTSLECNRVLRDIADTAPASIHPNVARISQFWNNSDFVPPPPAFNFTFHKLPVINKEPVTHKNPPYTFGFLANGGPEVQIIDVKPTTTRKPLVLLPVYLRTSGVGTGSLSVRRYDGMLRSAPKHPSMPVQLSMPY